MLLDPTGLSPFPPEVESPLEEIDEADGAGHRYTFGSLHADTAGPRPPNTVPSVVVSSAPDHWQRWPAPRRWWLPLTLVDVDRIWQEQQREWATRLSAAHVVGRDADHFVYERAPQLVLDIVAAVLAAARLGDQAVLLDADAIAAVGGDLVAAQR